MIGKKGASYFRQTLLFTDNVKDIFLNTIFVMLIRHA